MTNEQITDEMDLQLRLIHKSLGDQIPAGGHLFQCLRRGGCVWTLIGQRDQAAPPATDAAPDAADPRRGRRCTADIILTLAEAAGRRLTTTRLLADMEKAERDHAESVVKATLARLRASGDILNDDDNRGYYLPND